MGDFNPVMPFRVGGGENLADAPELIRDDEAIKLVNIRFAGRNRWTTRKAAQLLLSSFNSVCGIFGMPHGQLSSGAAAAVVYLNWTGSSVELYKASGRSGNAELVGTLVGWESVGERPKVRAAILGNSLWICDEGKQYGLTCYDPNDVFETGTELFQPVFRFNRSLIQTPSPIMCRDVATYNNFLFVCGYGDETDPDQPEIVRFSYLGLERASDEDGAGDAGADANPDYCEDVDGNQIDCTTGEELPFGDPSNPPKEIPLDGGVEGLFDVDDYFSVGQRGIPVVGMAQGAERLVIATRFAAYILFGYDRLSFELDLIDGQRGLVATRAIGEADGVVFWYSPLGPCRWAGGDVLPMEERITPLLEEIDFDTLFFFDQPREYEAQWLFSTDGGDPNRAIKYNYLYDAWHENKLGLRVFCGGHVKPGSILTPGPGGEPVPGPGDALVPPSNLNHINIGRNVATATWVNNETGPTIVTRAEFSENGTDFFFWAELPSGGDRFNYSGLLENTTYTTRVRHEDSTTGAVSAWTQAPFTTGTNADCSWINPPANFNAESGYFVNPITSVREPVINVTWEHSNPGVSEGFTIQVLDTATSEVVHSASTTFPNVVGIRIKYGTTTGLNVLLDYKVRMRSAADGCISDWTNEITVPPPTLDNIFSFV
jgi:hypothetical protein